MNSKQNDKHIKLSKSNKQVSNQYDIKKDELQTFLKILQLFPELHSLALYKIFELCDKNYVRTIDNVLYVKRYCHYLNAIKKPESTHPQLYKNEVVISNQHDSNITNTSSTKDTKSTCINNNADDYNNQLVMQMQNHGNQQYHHSENYTSSSTNNIYPENACANLNNNYNVQPYDPNKPWNCYVPNYSSSSSSINSSIFNYSNSNMPNASDNEYNQHPNNLNFYNPMLPLEYRGEHYSSNSSDSLMSNPAYNYRGA